VQDEDTGLSYHISPSIQVHLKHTDYISINVNNRVTLHAQAVHEFIAKKSLQNAADLKRYLKWHRDTIIQQQYVSFNTTKLHHQR
jgi:hypothetical protein